MPMEPGKIVAKMSNDVGNCSKLCPVRPRSMGRVFPGYRVHLMDEGSVQRRNNDLIKGSGLREGERRREDALRGT